MSLGKSLGLIWHYLRPHWGLTLLAPLCVLVEVWAELEQPDLMSTIVDEGILGSQPDIVRPTGIKMVLIMMVGVVGGIFSIFAAGRVAYNFGAGLRRDLYSRISQLAFTDVDRLEAPSLITRMGDDVNRVQQVVQASMRLLFRAPFLFVGSVVMALLIDVNVSVVLVFLMVVSFMFVVFVMRRTLPLFIAQQKRRDSFIAVIQEALVGVRVTKAYTNESVEQQKFNEANSALYDSTVHVSKVLSVMMPVVSFSLNAGIILIIYFGASEVVAGNMKIGGIMATINYLAQIQIALMMASHVIMSITQAEASISRISEVLDTPTEAERDAIIRQARSLSTGESQGSPQFVNGDIEFRDVSFAYEAAGAQSSAENVTCQLSNVSFVVKKDDTLAILGETGSGKSTLVHLIPRFYDPLIGDILIGGKNLKDLDRGQLQQHIAVVMQHSLLFAGSIADNLRMGRPDATDDELWEACRIVQMADHIASLADGLNHQLEQGATNLSGGQKQRLSIARALLAKPDVLIMDDSFCALDLLTESKVRAAIEKIPCTKIIVAQRISTIRNANKILLLRAGRVEACGSHDELMAVSPTYQETFHSQS